MLHRAITIPASQEPYHVPTHRPPLATPDPRSHLRCEPDPGAPCAGGWTLPARAASFIVTKTADTADGTCDADCSLREAISAANGSPGADIITVPAGTFVLKASTYTLTFGALSVTGPAVINGAGPGLTVIDGASGGFNILQIGGDAPISVTLSGLTIRGGYQGINVRADLTLRRTEVVSNTSSGIYISGGTLTVLTSTMRLQHRRWHRCRGGVERLVLQGSTITWNTAGRAAASTPM